MFKTTLYNIPDGTFVTANTAQPKAPIVVFLSEEDYTSDSAEMLRNILGAAQLNMDKDCNICTTSPGTNNHYYKGLEVENVSKIIVFGLSPDKLSLHITTNLYVNFELDGKTWLFADALSTLVREKKEGGKQKRVALWKAMKQLFEL